MDHPTKLPSVLIENEEILYKLLIHVFSKTEFFNVTSCHLSLAVNELESLYLNHTAKLQYAPNIIYLPKPGRYRASHKGRTYWLTFSCSDKTYLTTAMRNIDHERSLKI